MDGWDRETIKINVICGALAAAATALLIWTSFQPAAAHEATNIAGQPTGWSYPWSCCSNMDCKAVDAAAVSERPSGYDIAGSTDDTPIPYGDTRIKDSPDGDFHWCAHQAGVGAGKTICLFVPPKGF